MRRSRVRIQERSHRIRGRCPDTWRETASPARCPVPRYTLLLPAVASQALSRRAPHGSAPLLRRPRACPPVLGPRRGGAVLGGAGIPCPVEIVAPGPFLRLPHRRGCDVSRSRRSWV